jgi:hypothetical protein
MLNLSDSFNAEQIPVRAKYSNFNYILDIINLPFSFVRLIKTLSSAESTPSALKIPAHFKREADSNFHFSKFFDLPRVKKITKKLGITINDYVLAIFSISIKKILDKENLTGAYVLKTISTAIPINMTVKNAKHIKDVQLNNSVTPCFVNLPLITDIKDSVKIKDILSPIVRDTGVLMAASLLNYFVTTFITYTAYTAALQDLATKSDFAVTNVAGPSSQIYFGGNKCLAYYPVVTIGNFTSGSIVTSYNDKIQFTVIIAKHGEVNGGRLLKIVEDEIDSNLEKLE